ncbi:MAG: hypothetical protein ACJ786_12650 [Catenulispora sp.]
MNRSIKNLVLAAGLAVATVSLAVPAHADPIPNGPGNLGTVQPGPVVDPKPQPQPVPAGPSDIANPPKCTHGCGGDQGPEGPKDLAPAPTEDVVNGGPLEAAPSDPKGDPADDASQDQGCFTGCDLPEEPTADPTTSVVAMDSDKPSASDQLDRADGLAPATNEDGGIDPLLFILGGAGAGALVLAAAARRRRQQQAA